jgi:histone H3/H4
MIFKEYNLLNKQLNYNNFKMSLSMESGISHNAINRLLRKAGAKRISGLVYGDIYAQIDQLIEQIVKNVVVYAEYHSRKTIMEQDVVNAVQRLNMTLVSSLSQETSSKKLGQLFVLPRENFKRAVVKSVKDHSSQTDRFQKNVILLIQLYVETSLLQLCRNAQACCAHASRLTLFPSDLTLANTIMHTSDSCRSNYTFDRK